MLRMLEPNQMIVFLLLTLPFSARNEAEVFRVMSKKPPLMTAYTTFSSL